MKYLLNLYYNICYYKVIEIKNCCVKISYFYNYRYIHSMNFPPNLKIGDYVCIGNTIRSKWEII